jgi:ABC-2 type transport system permease protein
MQTILAIWQREMKGYFVSPIAYVVLTLFLLISGVFFFGDLNALYQYTMSTAQMGQGTQPIDVPGEVVRSLFGTFTIILLFLLPMLTMGVFAEEKKRGTIELLLTTPVGNLQALLGKFLATLTFLLILFASTAITISPLFFFSKPDWKPMLVGFLGMFLYGAAILALGVFISTLTENQIIAVFVTFVLSLVLLVIRVFADSTTGIAKDVINYLALTGHLDDFIKGVIDTSNVIYYVTFAFVGLFLAYRSLESMRWKA